MNKLQRGFSLLEILVAVLVVGIGVLGITTLQITTNVYNESSMHRGQAAMLAREIVERMRVNVDEAKKPHPDGYNISGFSTLLETDCVRDPVDIATPDCTPEQMKDYDLSVWSARVSALLPAGDATINTVIDPHGTGADLVEIGITLSWTGRRSAGKLSASSDTRTITQAFTFELHGLM